MKRAGIEAIKTALAAAGCTYVLYESEEMANNTLDITSPEHVVGVLLESNSMIIKTGGNSVRLAEALTYVEILQQAEVEDTAERNLVKFETCAEVAGHFVGLLIASGVFGRVPNVQASKVRERRYDANLVGWSLAIDLQVVENAEEC